MAPGNPFQRDLRPGGNNGTSYDKQRSGFRYGYRRAGRTDYDVADDDPDRDSSSSADKDTGSSDHPAGDHYVRYFRIYA